MIAILNASMFGTRAEVGEHVDWSMPDIMTEAAWSDLLGMSVEEYAAENPHMIVYVVGWLA